MPTQKKTVSVAKEIHVEQNTTTKKKETVNGGDVFADCSFSSLGLHHALCDQLKGLQFSTYRSIHVSLASYFLQIERVFDRFSAERLGFQVPTWVQSQAIPVVLSGRHVYPLLHRLLLIELLTC